MIFIKNGDLKVAIVEAIGNLWAPKASYEINPSIFLLINEGLFIIVAGIVSKCVVKLNLLYIIQIRSRYS